jgi:hypothetical protein
VKLFRGRLVDGVTLVHQWDQEVDDWLPLPLYIPDTESQPKPCCPRVESPTPETIAYSLLVRVLESHEQALHNYRRMAEGLALLFRSPLWEMSEDSVWRWVSTIII